MGALVQLHRQGKALYVGISSYAPELTRRAAEILAEEKVPLFIHQPSYSILNRWIERELLATLDDLGTGCIAFSPLAQGMLTDKYLHGVPPEARANRGGSLSQALLSETNLAAIRNLNAIASERGQTLAQMAIAWVLRDPRVTSALVGARTVEQLDDSLDAIKRLDFSADELAAIDKAAEDGGINLWAESSDIAALPAAQGVPVPYYLSRFASDLGVFHAILMASWHERPGTDRLHLATPCRLPGTAAVMPLGVEPCARLDKTVSVLVSDF